jgi:hypothetical protein
MMKINNNNEIKINKNKINNHDNPPNKFHFLVLSFGTSIIFMVFINEVNDEML